MIQAGWLAAFVQDLNNTITLHNKPNGTRDFPSPSCCNLKENYPEIESGMSSLLGWGGVVIVYAIISGIGWGLCYCLCHH